MAKLLKKKYRREKDELVKALFKDGRRTVVLCIEVLETSKLKGYLIYECTYLDNGKEKVINIIAQDITDAMSKLDGMVDSGIPQQTANLILGSESFAQNKLTDE
jgi:hypothetical protein